MTPYEIDILLYYYSHWDDHPQIKNPPPIWPETIAMMIDLQLLTPSTADRKYDITVRGKVFVKAICDLPLPEWRMP